MEISDNFFESAKQCLINPDYYKNLAKKSFFSALKYIYILFVVAFFITAIKQAVLLIPQAPKLKDLTANIKQYIRVAYPKELVLDVRNGNLKTNVEEPYFIDLPFGEDSLSKDYHLITIDTKAKFEDFSKYKTGVLVTKTGVITKDNNALKVYPFESNLNFTMHKSKYDQYTSKIFPYVDYIPTIIVSFIVLSVLIGPFFAAAFALIGQMIFLLFISILFFIIAKILKKSLTYGQNYIMAFYGLTVFIFLDTIKNLLGVTSPDFVNSLPKLVYLIFMIVVLFKYQDRESVRVLAENKKRRVAKKT